MNIKRCEDQYGNPIKSGHDWILDIKTQICNNCGLEIKATKKLIAEVNRWKKSIKNG